MRTLRSLSLALSLGATLASSAFAADGAPAPVTPVRVERVRPARHKHPTLRFLRANRDFVRLSLDRTREKALESQALAGAVDPRWLQTGTLIAAAGAAGDSAAAADRDARGRTLLASVTQLGELEAQLDQLDRLLAAQRARLGQIQGDFTGEQHTALAIVLRGWSGAAPLDSIAFTLEDGTTVVTALDPEQRATLEQGGVVQVFHGFVEPREQVVQLTVRGGAWPLGDSGFVTLEPARDRVTLLQLDLSPLGPEQGAPAIAASTWGLDERTP